jgi:alpha-L-rhamnosidase
VRRVLVHGSALGLVEWHLNGVRVGDAYFEPGWADYAQRVHYRTHDVTDLVREGSQLSRGDRGRGVVSGYVGYGLLVGYGPNRVGRYFTARPRHCWSQLEIEYADGSRAWVLSDPELAGDRPRAPFARPT